MTSVLRADLHVTSLIPIVTPKPLPFGIPATWSHMASTLIHGEKEAVLVDPPLTIDQGNELAAWIKTVMPNKKLTTVFITHGHGDHYFAITPLLRHFPGARAVATPAVLEHMEQQVEPQFYQDWWEASFPGQLEAPEPGLIQPLPKDNTIDLEGHKLHVVEAGHSDTYDSTFLHIPDLSLVVAGDICYNELHQWLVEATSAEKRGGWIAALEKIAALKPGTVIASHKRPGAVDGINNVYSTIAYIRAFGDCKAKANTAEELYKAMIAKYPNRINPIILWLGCEGNFPGGVKVDD
jgi:glyoxylase-like metal-dependent hydrolase (beta-lactamase superfamily II)